MKFTAIHLLFLLLLTPALWSQPGNETMSGEVSYVTSRNVYVKFVNTDLINIGDTLRMGQPAQACLLVENKSSSSCVCTVINGCSVETGDEVLYVVRPREPIREEVPEESPPVEEVIAEEPEEEPTRQRIRGRISVSEYSNIGLSRDDRHRMMARFSLNADHIRESPFSFETYLNYRRVFPTDTSKFKPPLSMFRVYSFAVRYETPGLTMSLGRSINPNISSLGAIDGLQIEKRMGSTFIGAIMGSRPDHIRFSLNPNLLQYGAYAGLRTENADFRSLTTLGMMEQRNRGMVDRRYAYLQHSGTIAQNLSVFSSAELDLFSLVDSVAGTNLRLTNLYASAVYRFSRAFNMMLSYDSRKRIVYYETFQTEIERLLDDDIARQGLRVRINLRPAKYVSLGASLGRRFQSDLQNKSDNIYAYGTLSRIPGIGGRFTVSYNQNQSNYLSSTALSIRHSRSFVDGKLNADVYYRHGRYLFSDSETPLLQHFLGTNLSVHFSRRVMLSVSGERATFNEETNYRLYVKLIGRIYK